jgi:hypothetical protein
MFIAQIKTGMQATKALPGWGSLVNLSLAKALPLTLIKFILGRITVFNKVLYAAVGLVLFFAYVPLIIRGVREKVTSFWLFIPLLIAWTASVVVPNLQPFRLLLILPAFYLLLALGIFSFKSAKLRFVATAFILIVNLFSLSRYFLNPYFHREDWRGLVNYLKSQGRSPVILPSGNSIWPILYYDPGKTLNLVTMANGFSQVSDPLIGVEREEDRLYYVRYLVSLFDPLEQVAKAIEDGSYQKTREISFNQIVVWEYQKVK